MNEFVEECRREWRRLGVPDPVANEMAADLAADLAEAEAEGASAEEVLGSGAFDPRAFAAAWAAERGVVRPPEQDGKLPTVRRLRAPAAIAVFALVGIVGEVLLATSFSPPERVALATGPGPRVHVLPPVAGEIAPRLRDLPPRFRVPPLLLLPPAPDRVYAVGGDGSGVDKRTVGAVLLVAGFVGIVLSAMFWLAVDGGRRVRAQGAQSDPR